MNILRAALARMGYVKAAPGAVVAGNTTDQDFVKLLTSGGMSTAAGRAVTTDTAMQQTTVWTCTKIIAETVGSLPGGMFAVDTKTGNRTQVDHDLADILVNSPNADMDGVEYMEAKVANLALAGNGHSLINRSGKRITSLYPIPADSCIAKRRPDGTVYYSVNDRGRWQDMPREQIWHVKGFGTDGLNGLSPVGYQRQLLGMALATEEFQARFFSNGAMPSWLVSIPQWLNKDQRAIARENLDKLWGGTKNAYKAQLLEGGMSAVSATMPLQDAQFLELRASTRSDIFGMYRVPPHMGGDLSRSTNNNIEQQSLEFVMYCILPYLTRLERSISKWLLLPEERRTLKFKFNVDGLLRADAPGRAELYSKLLQNGALTRNEVRALEGRNRSDAPGMDDFTVQTQLVPIDVLRKVAEKSAMPAPPPVVAQPPKGLTLFNVTNLPATETQFTVHQPDVKVDATVMSPTVLNNIGGPTLGEQKFEVLPPDMAPVADAMREFSGLVKDLVDNMNADVELVKDNEGSPIGTRRKTKEKQA